MASTTNMARRKRDTDINIGDILQDVMWKGKENFVHKNSIIKFRHSKGQIISEANFKVFI